MLLNYCKGCLFSGNREQNATDELALMLFALLKAEMLTMVNMLLFHSACQRLNIGINGNGNNGTQRLQRIIQARQIC